MLAVLVTLQRRWERQLDDEATQQEGLRDISRWLTTPAACGLYLSGRDLERIGQESGIQGLPRSRRQAVEHLFRTAALDDNVDTLLETLLRETRDHIEAYGECGHPALDNWESTAGATLVRLEEMKDALAS